MKCKAKNKNGEPCGAWATKSGFGYMHDPNLGSERASARKRGGYRRRARHGGDSENLPLTVRTITDVLQVLDYTLAEALTLENSIQRGRLLVAIANEYSLAIKTGELEYRLQALETALKLRGNNR